MKDGLLLIIDGGYNVKPAAIICDLDKTLLQNNHEFSSYTLKVLNRCKEKGILIVFATSRSNKSVQKYINEAAPDAAITNGGSVAFVGGEIIFIKAIPPVTSNKLIAMLLKDKRLNFIRFIGEKSYFSSKIMPENSGLDLGYYKYNSFDIPVAEDAYKITVHSGFPFDASIYRELFTDCAFMSLSSDEYICKISSTEATKESALRALLEKLDFAGTTIAFGDDITDIEILKICDIGVATNNALPEVKAIADYICADNENDGVANFIEEHLLK